MARKPGSKHWRTQIQLHLGNYDSEEQAAQIYALAERRFRVQALDLRREYGDLRED